MRNQEGNSPSAQLYSLDFCQFIFGFFRGNAVDRKPSLRIVNEAEVLAGLLDRDNVHEASRVRRVGADLAVYFDKALHDDGLSFTGVESILESGTGQRRLPCPYRHPRILPVTDKNNEWHTISELVGTRGWARRVGTGQFVQKPM